jgi:hypothetical protein
MAMKIEDSSLAELLVDEELMQRLVRAVETLRERMHRAAVALEQAEIPYAVIGGKLLRPMLGG